MWAWITANLATILIALVLLAVVVCIVWRLIRNRKKGKSTCGCGCENCPGSQFCHKS